MFWWVILGTVAVVLVIAWLYDRSRAGRSGRRPGLRCSREAPRLWIGTRRLRRLRVGRRVALVTPAQVAASCSFWTSTVIGK